jgi:hypothetical protein
VNAGFTEQIDTSEPHKAVGSGAAYVMLIFVLDFSIPSNRPKNYLKITA